MKLRIRLLDKETKEGITLFNNPFDAMNGVAFYRIDRAKFEYLGADRFTGLKDRHGIEIYEGDIVDYHYFYFAGNEAEVEMKIVVEYDDFLAAFGYRTEDGFYFLQNSGTHENSFEVSGNVYENLELVNPSWHKHLTNIFSL